MDRSQEQQRRVFRPSRRRPLPANPRSPRYWPLHAAAALAWLPARLPASLRRILGLALGRLLLRLSPRRRHIVDRNLAVCFPQQSRSEREALLRSVFDSAGLGFTETLTAWFGAPDQARVTFEGLELLRDARARGGVLLVGAHFATMELAGALLSKQVPMDVIYRGNRNAGTDHILWKARRRHYDAVMERTETRRILRRLRGGAIVWYAADQDYGARHSQFESFFGMPAATINAAERLVTASGAQTLAVSHFRCDGGQRWHLRIRPVEPHPAAINRWLEEEIRTAPEQYLWLHRRFKTRPPGAPSVYDAERPAG